MKQNTSSSTIFLIDPDNVVKSVEKRIQESGPDREETDQYLGSIEFMKDVFLETFNAAAEYTEFVCRIPGEGIFYSFFNEHRVKKMSSWKNNLQESNNLYTLLMINTITFGLFNTFSEDQSDQPVRLSSRCDKEIKCGYFQEFTDSAPKGKTDKTFPPDEKILLAQNYNAYFKQDKRNHEQHLYSSDVLHSFLYNNTETKTNQTILCVPRHLAYICRHILVENLHKNFSLKLSNSDKVFGKYQALYNSLSNDWTKLSKQNRFLVEAEANFIYGFDFFNSLPGLLLEIEKAEANSLTQSLNDLKGASIELLITKSMNLPLYFGRFSFLDYACKAFASSPNMESNYFNIDKRTVARAVNKQPATKSQIVNDGYNLLREYFNILGGITVPVLYSLWVVVSDTLKKSYHNTLFSEKAYIETLLSVFDDYKTNGKSQEHTTERNKNIPQISSALNHYCSETAFSKLRHFYLYPSHDTYVHITPLTNTIAFQPYSGTQKNETNIRDYEMQMQQYNSEHRMLLIDHLSERRCAYLLDNNFYT